jgi:hypothetical protein
VSDVRTIPVAFAVLLRNFPPGYVALTRVMLPVASGRELQYLGSTLKTEPLCVVLMHTSSMFMSTTPDSMK